VLHPRSLFRTFCLLLTLFFLSLSSLGIGSATADTADTGEGAGHVPMFVFWGDGCPHCADQKPFLRELEVTYPGLDIRELEIWRTDTHHPLFITMARAHGVEPGSVPTTFVGGRVWVGDGPQIRSEMRATIEKALNAAGAPAQADPASDAASTADLESTVEASSHDVMLPLLGSVSLGVQPLVITTIMIAFIDGLNPCSLWVLTLLLGLVIHSRSRGRIALVGLTFLATTALIYGAFIAGVFSVLSYVLYLTWVQWLVALFALTFGLVSIKDYFWFRTGPSFTIADSQKPGIYQGMRRLMDQRLTGLGLVGATIVMAAGIALVELPCTAGFPVLWSGIVAERNVTGLAFLVLLGLYLLIYLLIELVVFVAALFTLRMKRFEEGHGRVLKLVGGTIMVALALVLILNPDLMNDIGGTLAVFLGAITLALFVMLVHRRLRASPPAAGKP